MSVHNVLAIMFHSVGLDKYKWCYSHISESVELFEKKMALLKTNGYATIALNQIDAVSDNVLKILLTFDDGYLDNWVYVYPVLKKYGLKATIFITPEFVNPKSVVRPCVQPGSDHNENFDAAICCAGFLSWQEMHEMESSGLVDIQSHALTHTWYFKGPRIVDFWHPGSATKPGGPVWMLWNKFPELKPYYLTEARKYESKIAYGTPIYEHERALITKIYYPDEDDLNDNLLDYVADHGGKDFFLYQDWRHRLKQIVDDFRKSKKVKLKSGRYESKEDYLKRVRYELSESKKIIDKNLNKTVEAICWPGGGVTEEVVDIARSVGYKYFTLPSAWKKEYAYGKFRDMIPRIGSMSRVMWRGRDLGLPSAQEFIWSIKRHRGSHIYKWLGRFYKGMRILWSYIKYSVKCLISNQGGKNTAERTL